MRLLGLALLGLGVGLIGMFCVVYPPVSAGSDYAAVNGIGFVVGPIGLVLVLAGVAMMFERGGPPRGP